MRRAGLCLLLLGLGLGLVMTGPTTATAQSAPATATAQSATATAQSAPAALIADHVAIEADQRLVAEGRVEVLFDGYRLTAQRIAYDSTTDQLRIEGPMRIVKSDGTVLTAESAQLTANLSDGLLRSARMVLDQQLQLAAAEILLIDGRYTVLNKTVASSCTVCVGNPVPLWQIRSDRVIHDTQEQQLYFDHATLEVVGVPVLYLPRLRLPDPTQERTSGFLTPTTRITDDLGAGLKVPYFITLGQSADLTVTPYFSTSRTRTLELRYRQAFRTGSIELNGAVSRDDLRPGKIRAYLFADGTFDLPRDFVLSFGIESVSDKAYLLDYGYSDKDRLTSDVDITRTRRDEFITGGLTYFNTLRDTESNQTIPNSVFDATWIRRFTPAGLGGIAELDGSVFGFNRRSGTDIIGRDLARASLSGTWQRSWDAPNGMLFKTEAELALDYYTIHDDSTTNSPIFRSTPFVATELRWPLVKTAPGGATQVLEPVVQLVWSNLDTGGVPNEDSLSVAFDEGNLFSLSRFAGNDVYEQGLRANLGLSWTRQDPAGWSLGVTVGRIFRTNDLGQFSDGSGLAGGGSDWLAALQLSMSDQLKLTNRAVFDGSFDFTRNEMRLNWTTDKLDLSSSYIWQVADPTEHRPNDSAEWVMDAQYQLHPNWTAKTNWGYDFVTNRAASAGLGLVFSNECVAVDVSLSHRFTSSTNVSPTTNFSLNISLNGFGKQAGGNAARHRCVQGL